MTRGYRSDAAGLVERKERKMIPGLDRYIEERGREVRDFEAEDNAALEEADRKYDERRDDDGV